MRLLKIKRRTCTNLLLALIPETSKTKTPTIYVLASLLFLWLPCVPLHGFVHLNPCVTPSSSLALAAPRSEALAIPSAFWSCVQRPPNALVVGGENLLLKTTPKGKTDDGNHLFSNTAGKKRQLLWDFSVCSLGPRSSKRYLPRSIEFVLVLYGSDFVVSHRFSSWCHSLGNSHNRQDSASRKLPLLCSSDQSICPH